jgi:hypothetical protein
VNVTKPQHSRCAQLGHFAATLQHHLMSAVRDCLFNIFVPILHTTESLYFIWNPRTRHGGVYRNALITRTVYILLDFRTLPGSYDTTFHQGLSYSVWHHISEYLIQTDPHRIATQNTLCKRVYPKVPGLAAWSKNCKWYSSQPLDAVVSPFFESV